MQTASAAMRASLARKNPTYKKVVELYRRYWDTDEGAYVYGPAQDITAEVVNCGRIMWKLDKEEYGVFNLDNTTITLRNDRQQWKQDNPKGYFPAPYILAKSKLRVKIGVELADGTYETLYVFTGYINSDPIYDLDEKQVTATLYGAMSIFDDYNAEAISTVVTDELLGQDSGTEFTTAQNGVGIIVEVKRGTTLANAVEIKPGVDYNASQQNDSSLPLKITLTLALAAGEKLYITYRYWYTDKPLEWIVEQIMTLCGITSYSISKAIFATSVENTQLYTSQAEWETFTDTNALALDKTTTPGNVVLADGFPTVLATPTWTAVETCANTEWRAFENGQRNGYLPGLSVGWSSTKAEQDKAEGTWQFQIGNTTGYGGYNYGIHHFMSSNGDRATSNGYAVGYVYSGGVWSSKFYRVDAGTLVELGTITGGTIYRVSRAAGGVFKIWGSSDTGIEVTDNTYTTSSFQIFSVYWNMNKSVGLSQYGTGFGYCYSPENATASYNYTIFPYGTMDAPVIDCGADIVTYGPLQASELVPDGTATKKYTYSSDSADFTTGNDPAGWVEVDSIGNPTSAVKRYLQVRWRGYSNAGQTLTPTLLSLKAYWYTSTTNISLVNLTGMTARAVLEQVAQMCNYELGFTPADMFIFRARNTTLPAVLTISDENNLRRVSNVSSGIDRVYNRVRAVFGAYTKVADATGDTEPNSVTKYGTREYSISNSQLLPAENANMAYSVAPTILAYTKTPRKRCEVEIMLRPDLELGDKVTLSHKEPSAFRVWYFGDQRARFGQADLEFWTDAVATQRLTFWKTSMRTEGMEIDPETFECKLDLTEALE